MSCVIICALYVEAAPVIRDLNLKQAQLVRGFTCFENEEEQVILVISGTGKAAMAGAVASVLQPVTCDHMIFFSSCAGLKNQKAGDLFLVNKVTDLEDGRSYYPDLLVQSNVSEASLLCGEVPYGIHQKNRDLEEPYDPVNLIRKYPYDLYDMDTSGGVRMASKFLGPHQITILKTVTDHGALQDRESYEKCMEAGWKKACQNVKRIISVKNDENHESVALQKTAEQFHCSATMSAQLKQLYGYAKASGQNMRDILLEMEQEGLFPCKDREEGKKALHELTRKLTA